jgi:hypothetical protein
MPHHADSVAAIPASTSLSSPHRQIALATFAAILLVCAVALVAENVLTLGFPFEKNFSEGWNAYNAQRFFTGAVIYDADFWRVNNYPIVSFLVVRGLDLLVHDLLLSGRIVALVSFVALGLLAAAAIRRFGGDRIDAVFGGICALGFGYLVAPAWIAVDDPQTLAEAIALGGLVAYLPAPATPRRLAVAALFCVLGLFTKPHLVAIPLAITIDLAVRAPRRLPLWFGSCAAVTFSLFGLTQVVAGGDFLSHLFSPRVFTVYHAYYHLMKYLLKFKVPLTIIALCSWRLLGSGRLVLSAYGLIAISTGAILSGFEGASYNLLQDAAVFLAIAAGVMLHELRRWAADDRRKSRALAKLTLAAATILLAQPMLSNSPKAFASLYHFDVLLEEAHVADRAFAADADYVAKKPGLAICESLLLCYRAGQPFTIDPFNAREYILAGKLDEAELVRRVAAGEFAVIQLRGEVCDDPASASCHILHGPRTVDRFTDAFLYAVNRYYRIDRRSPFGVFYIPR